MIRKVRTDGYNYDFDDRTGFFARWGRTLNDDPEYSPLGPEIADIEISTVCSGLGKPCSFCYKGNTARGKNMTLDQFRTLFAKLPKNVTQIAFGIGDLDGNPDMMRIFRHARVNGVIPNVTTNGWGLDTEWARRLADLCGAVAVSRYSPKGVCYDAVGKLTDAGLEQVNIHMLCAESTLSDCFELLDDAKSDPRLAKLNAIVFLAGKKKGRGTWLNPVSHEDYKKLIYAALKKNVRIGFDSCSAHKFLDAVKGTAQYPMFKTLAEPCESGLFSSYIDVDGTYFPCSFSDEAIKGVNLFEAKDMMEVWNGPAVAAWRKTLLSNGRRCPLFTI